MLLAGHLDTSWSGDDGLDYAGLGPSTRASRPRAYRIDDGLYGLGAFNMKGGLAAAAIALTELATGPRLPGDVVFAGLAGESEKAPAPFAVTPRVGGAYEGRGFGARRFLERAGRIDFAVVAGPSALHVVNAQAGSLFVLVALCGRPAYLGRRRGGEQGPLEAAAALAGELRVWARSYRERHRVDVGLGTIEPGLTVGAIEGGWPFAPSTSPAVCHLYLDLRVGPGQSGAAAVRELRAILDGFATRHGSVRLAGRIYARGRGTVTPPDHPLVRAAVEVVEGALGLAAAPFPAGSGDTSNDTNHFRRRGIPSIKLGPSDRLDADPSATASHGLHVGVGDLVAAVRLYVDLARRLVTEGAPT